jgi:hypothetical protein
MKAFAVVMLLAVAPASAQQTGPSSDAARYPRLTRFLLSALGPETILQFDSCTGDARDFVFDMTHSWNRAEQTVTLGCLDGRGEPNSTTIRLSRYNEGKAVPVEIVQVEVSPDLYQLWQGEPREGDHLMGPLDADSMRSAIAAAAADVRRQRAVDAAMRTAEELGLPCP